MAIKQEVGPFTLADRQSGSYRYENVQDLGPGHGRFVYTVDVFDDMGTWRVMSGLYMEGGNYGRPEQVESVERFGSPMTAAPSFEAAKKKAYAFMRNFSGSPGYNGLLDIADRADW